MNKDYRSVDSGERYFCYILPLPMTKLSTYCVCRSFFIVKSAPNIVCLPAERRVLSTTLLATIRMSRPPNSTIVVELGNILESFTCNDTRLPFIHSNTADILPMNLFSALVGPTQTSSDPSPLCLECAELHLVQAAFTWVSATRAD